jgi:hypothetical protein
MYVHYYKSTYTIDYHKCFNFWIEKKRMLVEMVDRERTWLKIDSLKIQTILITYTEVLILLSQIWKIEYEGRKTKAWLVCTYSKQLGGKIGNNGIWWEE